MTVFFTGIYAPLTPDERVVLDEKLARNQKEFLGLTAQLNGDALISKLPDSVLLMVFAQHIAAWKEDIIDTSDAAPRKRDEKHVPCNTPVFAYRKSCILKKHLEQG